MEEPQSSVAARRIRAAATWARALGQVFGRVALFEIRGTEARVAYVRGIDLTVRGRQISLVDQTPLRWTVEAASPVVGSGKSPGGAQISELLGLDKPRAFAILPLVIDKRLHALAYADNEGRPLSLSAVSRVFEICERAIRNPEEHLTVRQAAAAKQAKRPAAMARAGQHGKTRAPAAAERRAPKRPLRVRADHTKAAAAAVPQVVDELPIINDQAPAEVGVVTADGIVTLDDFRSKQPGGPQIWRYAAAACLVAGLFGGALTWVSPPSTDRGDRELLEISPGSTVADIGEKLKEDGVIRSAMLFEVIARLKGVDRSMRAGHYRIAQGLWAWDVVEELHAGQVATKTITLAEGLTLKQMAELMEKEGLATREGFMEAARNPRLLDRYQIPGETAEGFLFPETYTFARGLSPDEMVGAMIELFFQQLGTVVDVSRLSPKALRETVTLASIVEREAKRQDEMARIAGVFINRLDNNMRLESCATVQYILDKPKERLRMSDLRRRSPYNTYLNQGLPPGPIASPSISALTAAFIPEQHEYLFFFARKDGSDSHIFTQTYAQHQKALSKQRRDGKI